MGNRNDFMQIIMASLIIGGAIYFFNEYQKQDGESKKIQGLLAEGISNNGFMQMEFTEEVPQIFPETFLEEFPCNQAHYPMLTPDEVQRGSGLL
jgi:hypothetical protein